MAGVASPCISICALDETTGFCKGCLRTSQEIANWLYYSDVQKLQVLELIAQRKEGVK